MEQIGLIIFDEMLFFKSEINIVYVASQLLNVINYRKFCDNSLVINCFSVLSKVKGILKIENINCNFYVIQLQLFFH